MDVFATTDMALAEENLRNGPSASRARRHRRLGRRIAIHPDFGKRRILGRQQRLGGDAERAGGFGVDSDARHALERGENGLRPFRSTKWPNASYRASRSCHNPREDQHVDRFGASAKQDPRRRIGGRPRS